MVNETLHIRGPVTRPVVASIDLPSSKSILNRFLLMSALQGVEISPDDLVNEADDAVLMHRILARISSGKSGDELTVLDCGNAGTVTRMAGIFAAFCGGHYLLTGDSRLCKRPVHELAEILHQAGVEISYKNREGMLPMLIRSDRFRNNIFKPETRISSQHLSGLLLTGPFVPGGISVRVPEHSISTPYVDMTIGMMRNAGARVDIFENTIFVKPGLYTDLKMLREPDWSSAAFFFQAAALLPQQSKLLLQGLKFNGLQGDEAAANLFQKVGVKNKPTTEGLLLSNDGIVSSKITADFSQHPDLFNAFAVTAALLGVEAKIYGIRNLKHKESDRVKTLVDGLSPFGFRFETSEQTLHILKRQCTVPQSMKFTSSGDHRVAISFALTGLRHETFLENPRVVSKSFPGFYNQLEKLTEFSFLKGSQ